MKKLLNAVGILLVVCTLIGGLTACTSQFNSDNSDKGIIEKKFTSYEDVYEEYSQKIREATPKLIEEYKTEAQSNTEGLNGLATISNNKITELATISTEGVEEMAKIMLKKGSGKYEEYDEWAQKLQDVYMEEAQKITDAYMKSAIN